MECITKSLENQHKKWKKKPAERVSSYIRISIGYKTKSGQVPRPITDRCPNKVISSTTKNDKRKQS
jgi:hypothetical protein